MEKERLKELFDLEQQLGINENDRFHNSEEGKKQYEAIFENQHACNDIKNEILIKNMKAIAAKKIEPENDLKAKNDEIENNLKTNIIDFVIWYREDNMSSYTPEHLAEWYLSVKNQK